MTALETVRLSDANARSEVLIAPSRGGLVTRFEVAGRPVLFLDEPTLVDETKNVRGGIPVLFPSPGPLTGERFRSAGSPMKQHGFARNGRWTVSAASARECTLVLEPDGATRAMYPFDFRLTFRHVLDGARLTMHQQVENTGKEPMPFALGLHPYFAVNDADKGNTRVPTRATRAFDNVQKREVALELPIDLTAKEVDLHLIDHGAARAELVLADGGRVVVEGSAQYERWVVWTLAGKDFVCLEPWTAAADALNTGKSLIVLAPGEAKELLVSIAVLRP